MTARASSAARLLGVALTDVGLPCGVAIAAGTVVAHVLAPHWQTIGAPYFLGDGKNVENAAVAAAIAAGAVTPWLAERRAWRVPLALVALAGWIVLGVCADLARLATGWWQVVTATSLALALRLQPTDAPARGLEHVDLPRPTTMLVLLGLAAVVFTIALESLVIDVFHHGEVLASALDLLRGGRPFESFIWPHGMHDTGLAAGWLWLTGKVGTSPVALARATCRALAVVTGFAFGRVVLGTRGEATALAAGLAAATVAASTNAHALPQAQGMHQLGIVVFVALGFAALATPGRGRMVAAGAWFALAYLFRVEVGVFGLVAAAAVLAQRHGLDRDGDLPRALAAFVGAGALVAVGMVSVLAASWLVLGWPAGTWLDYTLRVLPRYHRDAVGLPFPWPLVGAPAAHHPDVLYQVALGWLVFVTLLLGQAVRALLTWRDRPRATQLLFLAVFAWLATRSSLDRSDDVHVLQWSLLPLVGTITLGVAIARDRFGWRRSRSALVLVLALGCFDAARMAWWPLVSRGIAGLPARTADAATLLAEHLAPNPPIGDCADQMFTPTESRIARNAAFIADTCATERLLAAHHVARFVVQHSAPWYEVRFAQPHWTKYFNFSRAYTPAAEGSLVDDVRAARAQALLRVRGYDALTVMDVADGVRVPIVDAYLRARRRGVAPVASPIGDWFFWDEAAACPAAAPAPAADAVRLAVAHLVYLPETEMLAAEGTATDPAGAPLAAFGWRAPDWARDGDLEYGVVFPDDARDPAAAPRAAIGWRFVVRVPRAEWHARRGDGRLVLDATLADGRRVGVTLALAAAIELPPLGGGWTDTPTLMDGATSQGRADRDSACRAGDVQPCACPATAGDDGAVR